MLIGMPDQAIAVDEPGTNTAKCPKHEQWLYRRKNLDRSAGFGWCCSVEGCNYRNVAA